MHLFRKRVFRAQTTTTVKSRTEDVEGTQVFGVSKEFKEDKLPMGGRYFSESESRTGQAVAILGNGIAEELFPQQKAVGKEIALKGKRVIVIGVLQKEGKGLFGGFNDDAVFYPFSFTAS